MRTRLAAAALCLAILGLARPAHAEWTEKDVQRVAEQVQKGKAFFEWGSVGAQVFTFAAGRVTYLVDVKAQLCFVGHPEDGGTLRPFATVPCASLKKGYPLFAPLITWE